MNRYPDREEKTTKGIHPTALVDRSAQIDSSATIGPFTLIGPHVQIAAGTTIGAHCVIDGHTRIGEHNTIFQFNSLGAVPQDKKYAGEPCELIIGNHNTIREFCTFNIGTLGGGGITRVGSHNWIMAYVHLAHDCRLGDHTILANNAQLAGHVEVEDWVMVGGNTGVRQFVRLGAHSMTAMCAMVLADVPPFVMCQGHPAQAKSMNYEGLRRRGFSTARIAAVKAMHRALYRDGLTLEQAQLHIANLALTEPESAADVQLMNAFLAGVSPQRGIVR